MRRVAAVSVLTLSAWLGFAGQAEAQCLVTPAGPTAFALSPTLSGDLFSRLSAPSERQILEILLPRSAQRGGTQTFMVPPAVRFSCETNLACGEVSLANRLSRSTFDREPIHLLPYTPVARRPEGLMSIRALRLRDYILRGIVHVE